MICAGRCTRQKIILNLFFRSATTREADKKIDKKIMIKDAGLKMTEAIRNLGYNEQMLTVYSSLIGEKALDTNSFTRRLIR